MKKELFYFLFLALLVSGCSGGDDETNMSSRRGGAQGGRGGFNAGMGGEEGDAVSVKAFRAVRKPVSSFILSNTTLESIRKVTIFARLNAVVEELLVEEGDSVRREQVLARLEDREIRNELDQAKISVEQADLALEQAKVRSQLSIANYERSQSLFEQKLISQQEFDQAELNNRTDSIALEVASEQAKSARARLEAAQIQLDYTEIRSSIEGVVTERLIEVGTRVTPNQAVFNVEDFNPLWARIYIPERELPSLRLQQVAKIKVQAFPERDFQGQVHMISPTVDPDSGTVKVTLQVQERRGVLRPGMFGTVHIATETHPDAIVIPKRAVLRERDENRVFVIQQDGTVQKKTVTLGFTQENEVEVLAGIQQGEAVVTVGQEGLNDGYPVSILAWEGGAPVTPADVVAPPSRPDQPARAAGDGSQRSSPGVTAPEAGPAQAAGNGQRGRRGPGRFDNADPEMLKAMIDRMMRNPEFKKAYEERLKENPKLGDDPEALREFMQEMRGRMRRRP